MEAMAASPQRTKPRRSSKPAWKPRTTSSALSSLQLYNPSNGYPVAHRASARGRGWTDCGPKSSLEKRCRAPSQAVPMATDDAILVGYRIVEACHAGVESAADLPSDFESADSLAGGAPSGSASASAEQRTVPGDATNHQPLRSPAATPLRARNRGRLDGVRVAAALPAGNRNPREIAGRWLEYGLDARPMPRYSAKRPP